MVPRATRWAAGLAVAVALVSLAEFAHEARGTQRDFATRYAAGVAVRHGQSPYETRVLYPIEQGLEGFDVRYVFRDPPPVAAFFRVVAVAPFRSAQFAFLVALVVAAVACAWLAAALLGIGVRGVAGASLLAAVALTFAPLRNGLSLEQIDPLVCALSLFALSSRRAIFGGVLQAIATMKPQATLLVSAAGLTRDAVRFVAGMLAGYALVAGAGELAGAPRWSDWLQVVRNAHRQRGTLELLAGILVAVLAAWLASRAWRSLRRDSVDATVSALALAAAGNAALTPFVFLNLHSDVLMLVPLGLVALRSDSLGSEVALGVAAGIFFVDGLFAVTYNSGVAHAVLPIALAAALAASAAVLVPKHRVAITVALLVNVAVTLPAFSPRVHEWLSIAAALLVLERL